MVKTTIKYVASLPYKSTASYFIKHIPDLIQLLILIALVFTFAEYRKANKIAAKSIALSQQNIELTHQGIFITQKTLVDSRIPWLEIKVIGVTKIDPAKFDGHTLALSYDVENKSDSPANGFTCIRSVFDPTTGTIHVTTNRSGAPEDCIMPHSIRHFKWYSQDLSGTLLSGIKDHQWICSGHFNYADVYGHNLGVKLSGAFDRSIFVITGEKLTGYFPQWKN